MTEKVLECDFPSFPCFLHFSDERCCLSGDVSGQVLQGKTQSAFNRVHSLNHAFHLGGRLLRPVGGRLEVARRLNLVHVFRPQVAVPVCEVPASVQFRSSAMSQGSHLRALTSDLPDI